MDAFAYVWDIMPTILDLAQVEYPKEFGGREIEPMMGRSMAKVLSGSAYEIYGDDEYVSGEMLNGKWTRKGAFKAVSVAPPYGSGEWHLYNVVEDPGETKDLSAEMPELLKELQAEWEEFLHQGY